MKIETLKYVSNFLLVGRKKTQRAQELFIRKWHELARI
jgi:hypothetical protein